MSRNKIGIVCTSLSFGGLEMYTLQLAEALKQQGWAISLLLNEKSKLHELALDRFEVASIQQYHKEKNHYTILKKWNEARPLDLMFTAYNKDLKPLAFYKRFFCKKLQIVYQQQMKVGIKKRDIIHRLRYQMLDAWIAPLPYLKQETIEKTTVPEDKIHIIPMGLKFDSLQRNTITKEEARSELALPKDVFLIGVLGRVDPQKGQDFLIKVIGSLHNDQKIHLLIMGAATAYEGDAWSKSLQSLISKYNISDRVHFRPYQQDVSIFYHAIDVFAMASHGETYGFVTLEALYFEKPVIGVNTDGTKALLDYGKLGWLHELEDIEGFKRQLFSVLHNKEECQQKIRHAKQVVEDQFDFEHTVKEIDTLFKQLLSF